MTGNNTVFTIDQHRIGQAELNDAGGDLGHLRIRVRAGISGVRNQRVNLAVLDVQLVQDWFSKKKRPAQVFENLRRTAEVRYFKRWS